MDLTGCWITEDRPMEHAEQSYVQLLQVGAKRLTGHQRRLFQAEVCLKLCDGNTRHAERRFGWGRDNVAKGIHEYQSGFRCVENFGSRGRRRREDLNPQLAQDIRAIVAPRSYTDPELKSSRRYSTLSANEVRPARQAEAGPAGNFNGGERSVVPDLWLGGDQRLLGGRLAELVGACGAGDGGHQAVGDLSRQRAKQLGAADAVSQTDGAIRRLVGIDDPTCLLSALSQQI
jgi:hypothetical protein